MLLPKAANELAPVSGWVPAAMLSPVKIDVPTVPKAAYIEPPTQIAAAAAPSQGSGVAGLLNDLRSQRDKVEAAIRALEGLADAQPLRVKRDKLDLAIQATEALAGSDAVVTSEAPSIPAAPVVS